MRFVLDNSVVIRWLLRDGSDERLAYAGKVLDLFTSESSAALPSVVPPAAYLELALREGVPLATLDGDLRSAMLQTGVVLV